MNENGISAILLAAGSSRRMGRDKLALPFRGQPLLLSSLQPYLDSPLLERVILVIRPGYGERSWLQELAGAQAGRLQLTENPLHEQGMASSLRAGVLAAPEDARGFLLALGDMPLITPQIVSAVVEGFRRTGGGIVGPLYRGQRGHPVIFDAAFRQELLQVRADVGARGILAAHPEQVHGVPVDDPAVLRDVDRPGDLAGLQRT